MCTPNDPGCAHYAQAARWALCRGVQGVLSWSCHAFWASCRRPPCHDTKLYRDVEPHAVFSVHRVARAQCRVAARTAPCRSVHSAVSHRAQCRVTTHTGALLRRVAACLAAPYHNKILYRDTPLVAKPRVRVATVSEFDEIRRGT